MGCGTSSVVQSVPLALSAASGHSASQHAATVPEIRPVPHGSNSDADSEDSGNESDERLSDNMKRNTDRVDNLSGGSDYADTTKEKLFDFDASKEDVEEALALVAKYHLKDYFQNLRQVLSSCRVHEAAEPDSNRTVISKSHWTLLKEMKQLEKVNTSEGDIKGDIFALVGGAKLSVKMYVDLLKSVGVKHVTDKTFITPSLQAAGRIIKTMQSRWVNATDASGLFSCKLAEAGLFPYLAEDIKHLPSDFDEDSDVFDLPMTILHNCASNPQIRQCYRDIGAVQLLTPILSRKEKGIKLLTLLTLSYIIDDQDNHLLLADDSDFDFLLDSLSQAWEASGHREMHGYSLVDLLKGLGNLAQNDDNKKLLMKKGALKHLVPVLELGSEEEQQNAAKVVWELAFDKDNRQVMKQDDELMQKLTVLKTSHHKDVAKNAGGALWILDMDSKVDQENAHSQVELPPPPPPPPPGEFPRLRQVHDISSPKGGSSPASSEPVIGAAPSPAPPIPASKDAGHIMISYQWGNQKVILQIRDSLREQGFKVWMDVDNIHGSTLQAMAEAVEGAAVVLMCMSQRYKESPNCRTEVEYAFARHKPIVPLLMEKDYKPDGWLGILKGSKLFFDFSGKYSYKDKVVELCRELGYQGRADVEQVDGLITAQKVTPLASVPSAQNITSWSQKDVTNWLHKHQLNNCLKLKTLTGENIKFLEKLSQRAPEFFFTYLKHDLGLSSLNDLMHFSDAIDKLP